MNVVCLFPCDILPAKQYTQGILYIVSDIHSSLWVRMSVELHRAKGEIDYQPDQKLIWLDRLKVSVTFSVLHRTWP